MDRPRFYASVRARASGIFGTSLSQGQVNGCETILTEGEKRGTRLPCLAYILATAYHETANTMQPVGEYGRGKGRKYGVPAGPYGKVYYGRGYVQLTWLENYQKAGEKLGVNLVKFPEQAMKPDIAAEILFTGMEQGWFTGKRLDDYLTVLATDYVGARRIINGTDKASLIAGYAKAFETALEAAGYSSLKAKPVAGPISGPPSLDTPIPGATVRENRTVDGATPKPSNPKAPSPEMGDLGATPKSAGKTAAAAGIFAIITLTLATWWHEVTAWVSSLF